MVRQPPGGDRKRRQAQQPLPALRGRALGRARHADGAGPAADHRKLLQPAGLFTQPRGWAVAVYPVHRAPFQSAPDQLVRRPARHHGLDQCGDELPDPPARHVQRRLAAGPGGLQRRRRHRQPRHRAQSETRPAHRLLEPAAAQGNPGVRAQATGRGADRHQPAGLWRRPQSDCQRTLL